VSVTFEPLWVITTRCWSRCRDRVVRQHATVVAVVRETGVRPGDLGVTAHPVATEAREDPGKCLHGPENRPNPGYRRGPRVHRRPKDAAPAAPCYNLAAPHWWPASVRVVWRAPLCTTFIPIASTTGSRSTSRPATRRRSWPSRRGSAGSADETASQAGVAHSSSTCCSRVHGLRPRRADARDRDRRRRDQRVDRVRPHVYHAVLGRDHVDGAIDAIGDALMARGSIPPSSPASARSSSKRSARAPTTRPAASRRACSRPRSWRTVSPTGDRDGRQREAARGARARRVLPQLLCR